MIRKVEDCDRASQIVFPKGDACVPYVEVDDDVSAASESLSYPYCGLYAQCRAESIWATHTAFRNLTTNHNHLAYKTAMFKSAATKLAHNSTLPALAGNRDLRPLQDLITTEKAVLTSYVLWRCNIVAFTENNIQLAKTKWRFDQVK